MKQIEVRMEELKNIYDGVKIFLQNKFSEVVNCNGYNKGQCRVWVNDNFDKVSFKQLDSEGKEVFATEVIASYQDGFDMSLKKTDRKYKVECGYTGSLELGDDAYANRYRFLIWLYDNSDVIIPIFEHGISNLEAIRKEYIELDEKLKAEKA